MTVILKDEARRIFEEDHCRMSYARYADSDGRYVDSTVQHEWIMFLMGFEAAWKKCPPPPEFIDLSDSHNIDLYATSWESIMRAAQDSPWIPKEYGMSDWVADVCDFLKSADKGEQNGDN
jgi:hypothetical protein